MNSATSKGKQSAEDTANNLLTQAGLRRTNERVHVLSVLVDSSQVATVDELHEKLHGAVNKVTLYRMLERFADDGVVERVMLGDGVRRYEYQHDHHHHITCTKCGKRNRVVVPERVLRTSAQKQATDFESVVAHTLEFQGVCKQCAN